MTTSMIYAVSATILVFCSSCTQPKLHEGVKSMVNPESTGVTAAHLLRASAMVPEVSIIHATVFADMIATEWNSEGDRKFYGAVFLEPEAWELPLFHVSLGRRKPRIEVGLVNVQYADDGFVLDKTSGKPGIILRVLETTIMADFADVIVSAYTGALGGLTGQYRLLREGGVWKIRSRKMLTVS